MISDKAVAVAEHEGKAEGEEEQAAEASVDDAFHQDIYGLARAAESGLQHGKANLHSEHQERSHQCPERVDRIDDVRGFDFCIRSKDPPEEETGNYSDDEQKIKPCTILAKQLL